MDRKPPPPPLKLLALLIVGGGGLGLVAVGVVTSWGWRLLIPGFLMLLIALTGIWIIQARRDQTLR
jgi:hypothetical protein